MSQDRYELRFIKKAQKEFEKLDDSVKVQVNKGLAKLRTRADTTGKELENKRNMKLHGCRELKFKGNGIRVIYRITGKQEYELEIVMVLGIEDRDEDKAFKEASERRAELIIVVPCSMPTVLFRDSIK